MQIVLVFLMIPLSCDIGGDLGSYGWTVFEWGLQVTHVLRFFAPTFLRTIRRRELFLYCLYLSKAGVLGLLISDGAVVQRTTKNACEDYNDQRNV